MRHHTKTQDHSKGIFNFVSMDGESGPAQFVTYNLCSNTNFSVGWYPGLVWFDHVCMVRP